MAQSTAAVAAPQRQPLRMSYEEWLAWDGPTTMSEWVDGEVIVFMPTTVVHTRLQRFLYFLLGLYVENRGLGEVLSAPTELRLVPGRLSREPDIVFVAREHADLVTDKRIERSADLVIEIISNDSVKRDRVDKLANYAAAGIPEYWTFDPRPRRHRSDFNLLGADGRYEPAALDADGRYHSRVVPGFWLKTDWLWRAPLPEVRSCLLEIDPSFFDVRPRGNSTGA